MDKIGFSLVEQLEDQRSSEKTYTLKVENTGKESIQIHSVTPRIPDKVELVEIRDTALAGVQARHRKLCSEMSLLVSGEILKQSAASRSELVKLGRELISSIFSRYWFLIINAQQFKKILENKFSQGTAWLYEVENLADANSARTRFLSDDNHIANNDSYKTDPSVITLYDAKTEQLERIEQQLGEEPTSSGEIALVAPDSFFAMGYTLNFPRSTFNPKKYVVSIDVAYNSAGTQKLLGTATESVVISPNPFVLSVVAVLSGLLGLIVKVTFPGVGISGSGNNEAAATNTEVEAILSPVQDAIFSGEGASACILALLLFNIYEHVDIGKKIKIGVGWRSALTVGVLSGLFSERVVNALLVIVG